MNKHFYITGLPRSGTAWLANYLTTDKSICVHEASTYANDEGWSVNHYLDTLEYPIAGTADSAIWNSIHEIDGPLLFVNRPLDQVIKSIRNAQFVEPGYEAVVATNANNKLNEFRKINEGMEVDFKDLFDINKLEELWKYLIPEIPFNNYRTEMLLNLNVQQDVLLVAKKMERKQLRKKQ